MRLRLFSIVYRQPFLQWFEGFCVRSLSWPSNITELRQNEVVWDCYTTLDEAGEVERIAKTLGFEVVIHPITPGGDSAPVLKGCLLDQIKRCLDMQAGMLFVPPDTVFGDGSIKSLVVAAHQGRGLSIAVPHVRVVAEDFRLPSEPVSNAKLVSLAFMNLHRSWSEADGDAAQNNSRTTGVSWRRISTGLYAVTMRIPTIYLAHFEQSDLDYFTNGDFGCWDHRWPQHITNRQKLRLLASSDAAFMVELTPRDNNVAPTTNKHPEEIDIYWGDLPHQRAHRNAVCIFREGT